MRKTNMTFILLSLVLSGCQFANFGTSSSSNNSSVSTNSSSITSSTSSSSSSSSSSVDKTNWIKKGSASDSLNNSNEWLYNSDENANISLAEYFEDSLFLNYSNATNWNSVELFYTDSNINNATYIVSFDLISEKTGNITVNGEEIEIKNDIQTIEVISQYSSSTPSISIQFGTEGEGVLAPDNKIIIENLEIKTKTNAKDIIQRAVDSNNYTLSLTKGMNGYIGTFKYFPSATYFNWENTIDKSSSNSGYAENETGIFKFSKKLYEEEEFIVPTGGYYEDETGYLKGLYSSSYEFTYPGCKGIPSLHSLDLSKFDYELVMNESVTIKDGSSLKALSFLLDDQYASYYYAGVKKAIITLTSDNNLEIRFENLMRESSTFVLSDIGTTSDALINEFVNSEDFGPDYSAIKIDEELKALLKDVNSANYTVTKPNGCLFTINENYIYSEVINEETSEKEISGYIKLTDGIYMYTIINNEVILGEKVEATSIKNLAGLHSVSYFKDATKFIKTSNGFELSVSESDYEFYSFGSTWLNISVQKLTKISLTRENNNIKIGAFVQGYDNGTQITDWMYLEVSNIGNANIDLLDTYLEN